MNAKRKAKVTAKAIIKVDMKGQSRPIDAVVEKLDECQELSELAYATLAGAARAAARELGVYDKTRDRIVP